jgi:glycosyltransferase involved in cell wall biosynthesis
MATKQLNILWAINILLPGASRALGLESQVIGGWLMAYRECLRLQAPEVQITLLSPYPGSTPRLLSVDGDNYYVFPERSNSAQRQGWFRTVMEETRPDVIHIHGSESPHALDVLAVANPQRTVLSVQGLVSVISPYYYGGLTFAERLRYASLRDFLRHDLISCQQRRFRRNGEREEQILARVGHVIGRTEWDRAHARALQPGVHYYHCEEALRAEFYTAHWQREHCFPEPTLFVSQASFPLKGVHKLVEALPLVIRRYPNLRVHIAGDNLLATPWLKRTTYGRYLQALVRRLHVETHLTFLGRLSASQMVEQYLGARMFVSPSIIENSSNSVCEAQLLGTPVVASNVGGMMDLVTHRHTGLLYRFEETTQLADYICELLADDDLCRRLSNAERQTALMRHDRTAIAHSLMRIYQEIDKAQ